MGLIAGCGVGLAHAQTEGALLYLDPAQGYPGQSEAFTVEIRLDPRGLSNVFYVFAFIAFDTERLIFDEQSSSINTLVFTNGTITQPKPHQNEPGTISFSAGALTALAGEDVLVATLQFLAVVEGQAEVLFSTTAPRQTEICDSQFITLASIFQNGSYDVGGTPATPGTPRPTPSAAPPTPKPGDWRNVDVNQDGYVDFKDVLLGGKRWTPSWSEPAPLPASVFWTVTQLLVLAEGWHQHVSWPTPTVTPLPPPALRFDPAQGTFSVGGASSILNIEIKLDAFDPNARNVQAFIGFNTDLLRFEGGHVNTNLFSNNDVTTGVRLIGPGSIAFFAGAEKPLGQNSSVATIVFSAIAGGEADLVWLKSHNAETLVLDELFQVMDAVQLLSAVYSLIGPTPVPSATPSPVLPTATVLPSPVSTPTALGGNLLVNPGGETGDWSGWQRYSIGPQDMPTLDPSVLIPIPSHYQGQHHFGATFGDEPITCIQSQMVPVKPGATYEVSLWYTLNLSEGTQAQFSVSYINGPWPGAQISVFEVSTSVINWTVMPAARFVPSGDSATIVIRCHSSSMFSQGALHYDEVTLSEVSP